MTAFDSFPGVVVKEKAGSANALPDIAGIAASAAIKVAARLRSVNAIVSRFIRESPFVRGLHHRRAQHLAQIGELAGRVERHRLKCCKTRSSVKITSARRTCRKPEQIRRSVRSAPARSGRDM